MDNFNRTRPSTLDGHGVPRELALDVRCAADIDAPLLVTAPDALAAWIAELVHLQSARRQQPLLAFQVTGTEDDPTALHACFRSHVDQHVTLLVSDVARLTPRAQEFLERWLADQTSRSNWPVRIIASTPLWLHDLVERGAYSEELFYRLNKIHIDLMNVSTDDVPRWGGGQAARKSGTAGCDQLLRHPAEHAQ